MLIGSGVSIFVSVAAFELYTSAWQVAFVARRICCGQGLDASNDLQGTSLSGYTEVAGLVQVPGPHFPAPTAAIWLDMAALVNGGSLPPHVLPFCGAAALCAAALPACAFLLQRAQATSMREPSKHATVAARIQHWLPSGISFAVRTI